jgi:hypothetical protein
MSSRATSGRVPPVHIALDEITHILPAIETKLRRARICFRE